MHQFKTRAFYMLNAQLHMANLKFVWNLYQIEFTLLHSCLYLQFVSLVHPSSLNAHKLHICMFAKLSGVKTSYVDSSIERMNCLNQFLTLCRVYWYILNIMSYAFNKLLPTTHFRQYAQRSRVRKLQYIAELERRVQALQVTLLQGTVLMLSCTSSLCLNV